MFIKNKETGFCLYTSDPEDGVRIDRENLYEYLDKEINLFLEEVKDFSPDPYEEMKEPIEEFINFEESLINFVNSGNFIDIINFCQSQQYTYLSYIYDTSTSKFILKIDKSLSIILRFSSINDYSYNVVSFLSKEECSSLLEKFNVTFIPDSHTFKDFTGYPAESNGIYTYSFNLI